jgi:uncharacterized protein with HEPN domain
LRKDDLVYAGHMLDAAVEALALAEGRTRADFDNDRALALALTHLLQTIGEAARQTSSEFRALHPGIPWVAIVGMRHRIVHDYLHVDFDMVWDVVNRDLDSLAAHLKSVLPPGA